MRHPCVWFLGGPGLLSVKTVTCPHTWMDLKLHVFQTRPYHTIRHQRNAGLRSGPPSSLKPFK